MIYAGIMAAGLGVRMHRQDLPKPFLILGNRPIIIHALEQFWINERIDKIIVVVAEAWRTYAEDLIAKYNSFNKEITVISGGRSKTESVNFVVKHILNSVGLNDDDIILMHDAIRPFVTQRIIDNNIDTALQYKAATTVMTTNDTIIVSSENHYLDDVPEKQMMLAEQTPITFSLKNLEKMFELAEIEGIELSTVTELSRLYLRLIGKARLVRGEYSNTKIINSYDLEIANALLTEMLK